MPLDANAQIKLERQLSQNTSKVERLQNAILGFWYRKRIKFRFFDGIKWGFSVLIACCSPLFAWFYGSVELIKAAVATSILVALHICVSIFGKLSKPETIAEDERQADIFVRFGDFLNFYKPSTRSAKLDRDGAICAILGLLKIFACQTTGARKNEISVSLVLYVGSSTNRFCIRHRNPGNERPMGREFDSEGTIGHAVCSKGNYPTVINDIRQLGRSVTSPTQTKVNYRSIYFIPLDSETRIKGFVSIDCVRPYAFSGGKDSDIISTCEPLFEHLRSLI